MTPTVLSARATLAPPPAAPRLSVVVPVFNEQETIPDLYRRLAAVLDSRAEILFVDDGSRDATPAILANLAATDSRVTVLRLSRNFGHQPAVTAGLDAAAGDAIVVMDGDGQDPPELIPRLLDRWRDGFEVVYAVRARRKEHLLKRAAYSGFYRLLRQLSPLDIPLDAGDFCLIDRAAADALKRLPEKGRFVRGLRTFVGFRQTGLVYERAARAGGRPKYTLRKLVALAADGLIDFSHAPLRAVTAAGLLSAFGAVGLFGWLAAGGPGWVLTVAVVSAGTGVQLVALGVVGEYVRRIFDEVKGRPTYIVRETIRRPAVQERAA